MSDMKTTMNYLRHLLVLCTVAIAFVACGDDKDDEIGGDITVITPAEKTIVCNGTENNPVPITFSASGTWTARPSHGWMSLSKMTGGAGEQTIILVVSDNDDYGKVRIGTITIADKNSGKSVDITVTQGKKDGVLTFSSESQDGMDLIIFSDVNEPANNKIDGEVNVSSNYDYTIGLDKAWLGYQTAKNADGTTKVSFKVTDYDKLYADGGYGEKTCTVSFAYSGATRAPGVVTYKVKFPGITPYVKYYTDYEEEAEAVTSITLEEGDYSYTEGEETITKHAFLKMVYVKSNIAWQNVASNKYSVDYVGTENKSATFFESQTSVRVALEEMQIDDIDENITFKDVRSTETSLTPLNVKVPGLGSNYVYLDWSAFQPVDQTTGHFMFEAEGASQWEPVQMDFIVNTTNAGNEKVYAFNVSANNHMDIHEGVLEEEADWVSDLYEPDSYTGTILKSGTWTVKLKNRGDESDYSSNQPRYFALVAAPSTVTSSSDLFEDGYLKEEYEKNCIILGQKGKVEDLSLTTEYVSQGGQITVSPEGEIITINYTTNAPMGVTTFIQDVEGSVEDPYNWTGGTLDESVFKLDFSQEGVLKITVSENKTGQPRNIWCGLATYVENPPVQEKDCLLYTFEIVQAAK